MRKLLIFLPLILSITSRTLNIGDLSITNDLLFNQLQSNELFKTDSLLTNTMSVNRLQSTYLNVQSIYAEEISNPNGPFITVNDFPDDRNILILERLKDL